MKSCGITLTQILDPGIPVAIFGHFYDAAKVHVKTPIKNI